MLLIGGPGIWKITLIKYIKFIFDNRATLQIGKTGTDDFGIDRTTCH